MSRIGLTEAALALSLMITATAKKPATADSGTSVSLTAPINLLINSAQTS